MNILAAPMHRFKSATSLELRHVASDNGAARTTPHQRLVSPLRGQRFERELLYMGMGVSAL